MEVEDGAEMCPELMGLARGRGGDPVPEGSAPPGGIVALEWILC